MKICGKYNSAAPGPRPENIKAALYRLAGWGCSCHFSTLTEAIATPAHSYLHGAYKWFYLVVTFPEMQFFKLKLKNHLLFYETSFTYFKMRHCGKPPAPWRIIPGSGPTTTRLPHSSCYAY
jgi:hypothetical protein